MTFSTGRTGAPPWPNGVVLQAIEIELSPEVPNMKDVQVGHDNCYCIRSAPADTLDYWAPKCG